MRSAPSQTATVSLPAELLAAVDDAAHQVSATRSELVRAALRDYLRRLRREEAALSKARAAVGDEPDEESLAQTVVAGRRLRRSARSA